MYNVMFANFIIHVDVSDYDEVSEIFFAIGAISIAETREDKGLRLSAMFLNPKNDFIVDKLKKFGEVAYERVDSYKDDIWYDYIEPFQIGKYCILTKNHENNKSNYNIVIDARGTFGVGNHSSSRIILEMLDYLTDTNYYDNMLDAGCGSGILSIFASKKGIKSIFSVDIENNSINITNNNCKLNEVKNITPAKMNISDIQKKSFFNIITANLPIEIHEQNIVNYLNLLKNNGHLLISGFTERHKDNISTLLRENNFKINKILNKDQWCCIFAEKYN